LPPVALPPFKDVPGEERLKTSIKSRTVKAAEIYDRPARISNGADFLDLAVNKEFERLGI